MTVHVYTPGDSVTVLLNGSEVATSTLTAQDRGLASFTVPYAAGELTAIASRNGRRIGAKTLVTTGPPAALRLTSDVPRLATGRDALAHVLVEVVDAHGRVAPNAAVEVMFTVAGAGELTGVASGNPHNVDSFRRPRRYTWHGLALAILRPAKRPGALTIAAHVSGFRPATLTLPVTHSLEPPAVSR